MGTGSSRCVGRCGAEVPNVNLEPVHELSFPMYVVKVRDFLAMSGPPEAHCQIRQRLHAWQPGMFVIFVSHQWLGHVHPDPAGEQMQVLRDALGGLINGSLQIEVDLISALRQQDVRTFTAETRQCVADGFIFLEWFAIPQVTVRVEGVNEDVRSKAAAAVQSIPAYVEMCNLFIALVPELVHTATGQSCNYTSWLARGWCRAELWCHLLSNKADTSVIVVHSATEAEFMFPLDWQDSTIAAGAFTVEADREVVMKLGQVALDSKIESLSTSGPNLDLYRFYLACRPRMLGQEPIAWDLYNFLRCFRFGTFQHAVHDRHNMNGLLCALFSEDVQMLRLLLQHRADVNSRIRGLTSLGYFDSQTLLMAAVKSNQGVLVMKTLLDLRADPDLIGDRGENAAYLARSPLHVKMLLEARADLHAVGGPGFGLTPLNGVASHADTETVLAMLEAQCDPNPPLAGFGFSPLHGAVLFARRNRHAQQSAELLVKQRADVNCRAEPKGRCYLLCRAAGVHCAMMGFSASSMMMRYFASLPGITPLGMSALIGDLSLTKLLLESSAELIANDRGDTPEDLAKTMRHEALLPSLVPTFST
ncbi:unnamed protein product [Durusdinium trenchii]|uniref:Uncharacterized protein n=1 Tax=Durusdinium trenchii TaxID=1381693 RepID=A0ABP0JYE4_9DINO